MLMCLGYLFFSLLLGNPVQDQLLFIITIVLAKHWLFSNTHPHSIATSHLMLVCPYTAVLSLPMLMPPLLVLTKISKNAVDGLDRNISSAPLIAHVIGDQYNSYGAILHGIFPYIWRS